MANWHQMARTDLRADWADYFFTAELGQHTSCIIPPYVTTFKANVNIISLKERNAALSGFWSLAPEPSFYEASVLQSYF